MSNAQNVTANFTTNGGGGGPLPDPVVFVTQQYRDFLGREPDAQGLQSWVNALRADTLTRAQVIQSFMYSQEFQGRFAPLVRLYGAYFLRLPDYQGLINWFNAMYPTSGTGLTLTDVSEGFAQSPEFTNRYGSLNSTQFVTLLYRNVLGREPDAGGLAHWVGLLDNPDPKVRMSRGQVMIGFSESIEYQKATSNSVLVIMSYVGMLRRAPEQSGYDTWLAEVNAGRLTVLDLINGFLNSQEYANRF